MHTRMRAPTRAPKRIIRGRARIGPGTKIPVPETTQKPAPGTL